MKRIRPLSHSLSSIFRQALLLLAGTALVGCTKGIPQVEGLASKVDALKVTDGAIAVTEHELTGAAQETFSGTCWQNVSEIFVSDPRTQEWLPVSSVAQSGSDVDCSDGTFSIVLNTSAGRFFYDRALDLSAGSRIGFRATTSMFEYAEYFVSLQYFANVQLSFDSVSWSLNEGGTFNVVVNLNRVQQSPVTFEIMATPTGPFDFNTATFTSGTHTIPAGSTSITLVFASTSDGVPEDDATGILSITNPLGATPVAVRPGFENLGISITDDDIGNPTTLSVLRTGTDAIADDYLNGTTAPQIIFDDVDFATGFEVEILTTGLTQVPSCMETQTITVVTHLLNYTAAFSGSCTLTPGTEYIAQITTFRNSFTSTSMPSFRVNQAPFISQAGAWYALASGGSFTVNLSDFAEDNDLGDTLQILSSSQTTPAPVTINHDLVSITLDPSNTTGVYPISLTIGDSHGGQIIHNLVFHSVKPYTWTGALSSDWGTAGNWCNSPTASHLECTGHTAPPGAGSQVYIDATCESGANCDPVVGAAQNVNVLGIDISGNRTLTFAGSGVSHVIGGNGLNIETGNLRLTGANTNLDLNGPVDVQGTFERASPASGTTTANHDVFVRTGSNFNHIDGTFVIAGSRTPQLIRAFSTMMFRNLSVQKTVGAYVAQMDGLFQVQNDFLTTSKIIGDGSLNSPTFEILNNVTISTGTAELNAESLLYLNGSGTFTGPSVDSGNLGAVGTLTMAVGATPTFSNRIRVLKEVNLSGVGIHLPSLDLIGSLNTSVRVPTVTNLNIHKPSGNVTVHSTVKVLNYLDLDFRSPLSEINLGTAPGVIQVGQGISTAPDCQSAGGNATLQLNAGLNGTSALALEHSADACVLPNLDILNIASDRFTINLNGAGDVIHVAGDLTIASDSVANWDPLNNSKSFSFDGSQQSTLNFPAGVIFQALIFNKISANIFLNQNTKAEEVVLRMQCQAPTYTGGQLNGSGRMSVVNYLTIEEICGGNTYLTLEPTSSPGILDYRYAGGGNSTGILPGTQLMLDSTLQNITFGNDLFLPGAFTLDISGSSVYMSGHDINCANGSSVISTAPASTLKRGNPAGNVAPFGLFGVSCTPPAYFLPL